MEAIVWHGRGDIRFEHVADPGSPGPDAVRVRVAYAGICGTDLEEYLHGPLYVPVTKPHPLTGRIAPMIMGHEFSGVVEAVGANVLNLSVGDPVAADCLLYCGVCAACREGRYNLCETLAALGQMADGGLAEYVVAPAYTFTRLPTHLALDRAALAEPLAVAVRAVRRADIRDGQSVLVVGAGPIGLLVLQVAREFGAGFVGVAEPHPGRRQLALRLGADEAVGRVWDLSPARRFPRTIECTGRSEVQREAISRTEFSGRVVLVGIPTQTTVIDTLDVINGEKEIVGSLSHLAQDDFRLAVDLLADGRVQVEPMISRKIPLSQGLEAFQSLERADHDLVKILLVPGAASGNNRHNTEGSETD